MFSGLGEKHRYSSSRECLKGSKSQKILESRMKEARLFFLSLSLPFSPLQKGEPRSGRIRRSTMGTLLQALSLDSYNPLGLSTRRHRRRRRQESLWLLRKLATSLHSRVERSSHRQRQRRRRRRRRRTRKAR